MRVAIVSTPFVAVPPASYGGTELVVHELARALERLGHEVATFATGDSRAPGLRALFPAPVWPPEPYAELLHARFAAREIAAGGFDVAHLHAPAALAFADELGAPAVYTIHHARDARLTRFYALAPRAIRVAISRRQAALADPPADAVVHHGLSPDLYPDAARGDGGYAFFLGRLAWCKGPDLAIAAARRAGVRIVVAGRPHEEDGPPGWGRALARALAAPHVVWRGAAGLEDKRRLLAGARALLAPLRWEEPFGLAMLEANLAGCPVVAFRRGAAPEIVEDGVTGILVDDVREMAAAIRAAAGMDRAACQARARERFSAARMAAEYLRVYRAAARHAPREAGAWPTHAL